MTVGTGTYEGLAVPNQGEFEVKQQTAATDFMTMTGASSMSGDFIVCRNSTGAELFVVSASGAVSSVVGMSFTSLALTGAMTTTSSITATLSSTAANAFQVAVTSTGAIAAGTATGSAFYVYASSKSVLNSIITYVSSCTGGEVGTCNSFLAAHGSKAPTYLLSVGATAMGVGAAASNGLAVAGQYLVSALATTVPISAIKVLLGDSPWYIPCLTSTCIAAS